MCWMWCSAVRDEMNSCVAISPALRPFGDEMERFDLAPAQAPGSRRTGRGVRVAAGGVELAAGVEGGILEVERGAR
jgi:hypothetical protein